MAKDDGIRPHSTCQGLAAPVPLRSGRSYPSNAGDHVQRVLAHRSLSFPSQNNGFVPIGTSPRIREDEPEGKSHRHLSNHKRESSSSSSSPWKLKMRPSKRLTFPITEGPLVHVEPTEHFWSYYHHHDECTPVSTFESSSQAFETPQQLLIGEQDKTSPPKPPSPNNDDDHETEPMLEELPLGVLLPALD